MTKKIDRENGMSEVDAIAYLGLGLGSLEAFGSLATLSARYKLNEVRLEKELRHPTLREVRDARNIWGKNCDFMQAAFRGDDTSRMAIAGQTLVDDFRFRQELSTRNMADPLNVPLILIPVEMLAIGGVALVASSWRRVLDYNKEKMDF